MAIASHRIDKISLFMIFSILALALLVRAQYLKDYKNTNAYPVLTYSDGYSYVVWAKDISGGELWGSKAFMKWPLYAYFLALLFKFTGGDLVSVYSLQLALGAINCVLVYFIARIMFERGIAFLAALLCVWYGVFVFYDGLPIYNCLSLFLNYLLFLLILSVQNNPDKRNLFWIGILSGICTITKASILIFAIPAAAWILWREKPGLKKLVYHYSFFCLGLSIIIASVALRNYLVEKDLVLIDGNTGINFYLGNNPQADGLFRSAENVALNQEGMFRDARVIADNALGRNLKTSEVSRYWFDRGLVFARDNPAGYFKLLFKKFKLLFSPQEFPHEAEYYSITGKIRIFKIMFMDLRFILPFAFLGMLVNLKKFKETALLYMIIIALSAGIILFFVTTRYRVSMVPFLIIFASCGVFSLWEALKRANYLRLGWLCIALLSLFILFDYRLFNNNSPGYLKEGSLGAEYHLARALEYNSKSDYKNALQEIEFAYRLTPHDHYCLLTYGTIYYNMNDLDMAAKKFREAIRVFPLSVDAYYNLGLLYNKQQMFSQAKDLLIQAVSLDSRDFAAHFELGRSYKANGESKQAKKEFNLALQTINRSSLTDRAVIEKELADLK